MQNLLQRIVRRIVTEESRAAVPIISNAYLGTILHRINILLIIFYLYDHIVRATRHFAQFHIRITLLKRLTSIYVFNAAPQIIGVI